jgi:hypothetical protein
MKLLQPISRQPVQYEFGVGPIGEAHDTHALWESGNAAAKFDHLSSQIAPKDRGKFRGHTRFRGSTAYLKVHWIDTGSFYANEYFVISIGRLGVFVAKLAAHHHIHKAILLSLDTYSCC